MSSFSGPTRADSARAAALLALLALAAAPLRPASAAPGPSTQVPLSLGFGPANLSPVSAGVPVYTVGETVWAESGYGSAVQVTLASPSGQPALTALLSPGAVVPLYTFAFAAADGLWNLTLGSPPDQAVVPVRLVDPADHQVSLGPLAYSLSGGNLSISAQATLGDSYDQEVCAGGSSGLTLPLPRDMQESGTIALAPGDPFGLTVSGVVNESFSFWFELYEPFALQAVGTDNLAVDNLLAAQSQPVTFVSNGTATTSLDWTAPMRQGRYDLRGYFQNSTSLDVVQAGVLVLNDSSWVSLSGACPTQPVQSTGLSYSVDLAGGPASWPRALYLMYRTFGVEAVDSIPLRANLSAVEFVASPWNRALSDVEVGVSPSAGVLQASLEGGSLFVLASGYPVVLNYSLGVGGGQSLASGSVTIDQSYTVQTASVSLAELDVHVAGGQASATTLQVTGPGGISISGGPEGANQTASFFLPTGSYTVTGTQGGRTQSLQVRVTAGALTKVTLNFNAFSSLEVILAITAAVGLVADLLVWLRPRDAWSRPRPSNEG